MHVSFFLYLASFMFPCFLLFHLIQYSSKFRKVEKEIVFLQAATHWEAFGLHTPTMAVKAPLCVTDVDLSHRWA